MICSSRSARVRSASSIAFNVLGSLGSESVGKRRGRAWRTIYPQLEIAFQVALLVFISAATNQHPAALKDIRDKSANAMARVAAIRQAELMKADVDNPQGGIMQPRHSPGLIVQIVNQVGEVDANDRPAAASADDRRHSRAGCAGAAGAVVAD
jgi:hypothetical protein